jgi:hypothetical protein
VFLRVARRIEICIAGVLALTACSTSSGGGNGSVGPTDATAEGPPLDLNDDAYDTLDVAEAGPLPDATCTRPTPAGATTSSRCTPEGPGSWDCADASGQGWLYSCEESTAGAHPPTAAAGACSSFGAYSFADASYVVALCANAACTAAVQYDAYCDAGSAVACPDPDLEAGAKPAAGCVLSYIGEWSSGDGLPGPLYCCP